MLQGKGGSHHLYLSKPPLDLHAGILPTDKELAGWTEEGKGKIQESRVKSQESRVKSQVYRATIVFLWCIWSFYRESKGILEIFLA